MLHLQEYLKLDLKPNWLIKLEYIIEEDLIIMDIYQLLKHKHSIIFTIETK